MSGQKPSLLDWVLYFGSKDERHRRAADRAGHVAFYIAAAAVALDVVYRASAPTPGPLEALWSMRVDLAVLFLAGGYYTLQWVRSGITLRDTPRQRKVFFWISPAAGLLTFGILLWQWQQKLGWGMASLTGLGGGLAAWALCWAVYRWMDKAAARRLENGTAGEPD